MIKNSQSYLEQLFKYPNMYWKFIHSYVCMYTLKFDSPKEFYIVCFFKWVLVILVTSLIIRRSLRFFLLDFVKVLKVFLNRFIIQSYDQFFHSFFLVWNLKKYH